MPQTTQHLILASQGAMRTCVPLPGQFIEQTAVGVRQLYWQLDIMKVINPFIKEGFPCLPTNICVKRAEAVLNYARRCRMLPSTHVLYAEAA